MTPTLHRRSLLRLATSLVALPFPLSTLAEAVRIAESLELEGIPRFDRHALGSEQDAPSVRFIGWHPTRAEMLVITRQGTSPQLHRLRGANQKPQALTRGRDAVSGAQWEPAQGAYLVFSRDQGGNEAFRLYRLDDTEGAEALAITPAGERVSDYGFLPEGGGLVYLQEQLDRRSADAGGEAEEAPAATTTAATATEARQAQTSLWWTDPLQPGERRLLGRVQGARLTGLRISPAGRVLATLTRASRSQTQVFALDGSGGKALTPLRDANASDTGTENTAAAEGAEDAVWRRQALRGDFRHLVRLDARNGRSEHALVDAGSDLEALAEAPAGSGRPMALVYNVAGVSELKLYTPGGKPQPAAGDIGSGVLRNPQWHPRLPLLGFDQVSADSPSRVFAFNLEDGRSQAWSAAASGPSLRAGLLRWKSFDELEISGLHLAPPERFKGPRPVYISIHGGPASQSRPGYVSGVNRALVEQLGMHVIEPNVRGSDGFGRRFLKLDDGRLRENSVRDISALLDLIASRPDMDASRVVVGGGSYGGYMSLAVAVRESQRIAGSICRVGIANFVSFLENTESYRRDNRRAEYGDERDPEMRAFLQQISPLNRADAVKKPLFIVHGRNDPRVPFSEAQAMARAVRAQGTPVWFLSARDEGHSFIKADNRAYLSQASFEFIKRIVEGRALS